MIEQAVASHPKDPVPLFYLACAKWDYHSKSTLESVETLREVLRLDPEFEEARNVLENLLAWTGHLDEALPLLEARYRRDPHNAEVLVRLGMCHRKRGDLEKALEFFRESISRGKGSDFGSHVWLGGTLWQLGRERESEEAYREGWNLFPSNRWAKWMCAWFLFIPQHRFDEALDLFCRSIPEEPGPGGIIDTFLVYLLRWRPKATSLAPLDGFVRANLKDFAIDTLRPVRLESLALALLHAPIEKDPEKARELALRAVELTQGKNPHILASMATIQWALGSDEEAIESLEQAARLPGNWREHVEQLNEYRREILPRIVSYASFDKLMAESPEEAFRASLVGPPALSAYVHAHFLKSSGQLREAAAAFEALEDFSSIAAEPTLHRAECLRMTGDAAAAVDVLGAALREASFPLNEVWDQWWFVAVKDLEMDPRQISVALPSSRSLPPDQLDVREDFAWVLDQLAGGHELLIDSGSRSDWSSPTGRAWSRDRFQPPEERYTEWVDGIYPMEIKGASEDVPYRTCLEIAPYLARPGYRIPLPPGKYRVVLHFAETRWWIHFDRAFDVLLEGQKVLERYRPFAAGMACAQAHSFSVDVNDGFLDVTFETTSQDFEVDHPMISAIEVQQEASTR